MGRYAGIGFIIKYMAENYISLSGPASVTAMWTGAAATIFALLVLSFERLRRYLNIALLLALLPAMIGLWGTFHISREVRAASALEMNIGQSPSAEEYYDDQYGYSKMALYSFPAITGVLSSVLPISLWAFAVTRKKRS